MNNEDDQKLTHVQVTIKSKQMLEELRDEHDLKSIAAVVKRILNGQLKLKQKGK